MSEIVTTSTNLKYLHRQGIHATGVLGYSKIFNNIIQSARGNGLINIHFTTSTTSLEILNPLLPWKVRQLCLQL